MIMLPAAPPKATPAPSPDTAPPMPMDHRQMDHRPMAGHDHQAMIADFLRRFWMCLGLSVPLVAGSTMFQHLVGYRFTFPDSSWVLLGLATAIFGYGGWPFLSGTVGEVRHRQPGMRPRRPALAAIIDAARDAERRVWGGDVAGAA